VSEQLVGQAEQVPRVGGIGRMGGLRVVEMKSTT
jgi:hypothetical protein